MKRLFYTLLLLISLSNLNAQDFWNGANVPINGLFYDMVVTSSGVVIASTQNNGIWRSTNAGLNWTKINSGDELNIRDLEIDAGGNIYATTLSPSTARLLKSTDGGFNFSVVNATFANSSYFPWVKVLPNGGILLVGAGGSGLQISSDGGATFTFGATGMGGSWDLEADASGNIYYSASNTNQWISKSVDNGVTFTPLTPPTNPDEKDFTVFDITSRGTKIAAVTFEGLFLSEDSGATWNSITSNLTDTNYYGTIRFTPTGNLFFANMESGKSYLSADNGVSWTQLSVINPGMSFTPNASAFAFHSATTWLSGSANGVYRSTDSGANWFEGSKLVQFSDIFVSTNGTIYIAGSGTKGVGLSNQANTVNVGFIRTGNANRLISGFEELNGAVYGYSTFSPGIIRTIDNGANWAVQNADLVLPNLVKTNGILYSISGTSLLSSTDLAVNWTTTPITGMSGSPSKVLASNTPNILFAQVGSAIFKIDVSNSTATQLSLTGVLDFAIGGTALYVLTSTTTLQKSIDNGATFTARTLPSFYSANKIWAFDDQSIFTRNANNGIYAINISHNSGAFWIQKSLLDNFSGVSLIDLAFNSTGFAFGVVNNSTFHSSIKTTIPPKAPTNLKITVNSPATPTYVYPQSGAFEFIMEDNSNNEEYFVVQKSLDQVTWDSITYELPQNSLRKRAYTGNRPEFVQGTQYHFRIQTVNAAGRSAFTNVVSGTLTPYCVSTIPDNRSWTVTTTADPGSTANGAGPFTSNIGLITKQVNSGDRYTLFPYVLGVTTIHGESSMGIQENCGIVNTFSNGFDLGNGLSTWDSNTKTLTIKWQTREIYPKFEATTIYTLNAQDPAPAVPNLGVYVYSANEAFLTWRTITFASSYVIQRSTVSGSGYVDIATVNYPNTSYLDKNLSTLTTYYYRIKSKHNNGPGGSTVESAYTAEVAIQLGSTLFRPIETDLNLNLDNQQGSSWADLDGDGDEDLVLCTFNNVLGGSVPPSFFENTGDVNALLKRREMPIVERDNDAISRGAVIMDFNNDGKLDIYFDRNNSGNDFILINEGNWNFSKLFVNESTPGSSIENPAAADIDNDGFVDFYIGTADGGTTPPSLPNYLIKNNGGESVTQITTGDIVTDLTGSRSVSFADYDNDGDQDLLVLNFQDASVTAVFPQLLYKNNGDGTFTKVTGLIFDTDLLPLARTSSWGDIDNDGDLDLFIGSQSQVINPANPSYTNDRLYRNDGGIFTSLSNISDVGLDFGTGTFGSAFGDIDNDGDLDLLISNQSSAADTRGESAIFKNDGSGNFTKFFSDELFTNKYVVTAGISLADVDKDGFLDVFPVKGGAFGGGFPGDNIPNLLYKSTLSPSSSTRWLQVKLIGNVSNKAAIGARVTVVTTSPARSQIREVAGLTGYGSQNSLIQHFGLGTATTCTVTVKWPSGILQTLSGVTSNQFITITEDNVGPAPVTLNPANSAKSIAFNTSLEITFDEAPIKVAGKKVSLYLTSNLVTPVQIFDAAVGVVSGNKITFTPSAALTPNTEYRVVVEDGAFKDIYNNVGVYNALSWQFTSLDITLPVFGNPAATFPAVVGKGQASSTFSVDVTDNISVASVIMSYREAGTTGNYTELPGAFNNATNKWDFSVQESFYGTAGLEFYFTAKDPDNNVAVAPSAGVFQSLFETTPPVLTIPQNPTTRSKGFGTVIVKVIVTDNFSVASVVLSYRDLTDGTEFININGSPDGVVANQYNFTVTEEIFKGTGVEYYFTATDATGNITRSPAGAEVFTLLFESTPPVLVVPANPTLISKGFTSRAFTVTATDNFGVSSVVMNYRNTKNGVAYIKLEGTLNTTVADQYDFSIPESAFNGDGLEYFFTASDATGNTTRSPLETASSPTFKMLLDNQAPVVGPFTAAVSVVKANTTFIVKALDNIAVSSVVLKYRGITSKNFNTSVPGTKNANGDYEFAVDQSWFDNMGLEYYFRAVDASKNIGVSPDTTATTNKYHRTLLKFDASNPPKFSLIKGSTGASGYQIISVPIELSNKNIADNFDELGTADKTAYRFLRYRSIPAPGWDEYPGGGLSVLNRGEGYFLNSLKAEEITLLDGVAPAIDQANFFQLALKKGWNQIGNPYTVQIQWSDVLAYNNNPAGVGKLVKYDNGYNTNDADGVIEPYKGGFVQTENDVVLKIPFKGFTSGGRFSRLDSDLGQQNWELRFTLTQQDLYYQVGMIGMNENALVTKDDFDLPTVPRLSEFIEASFDHPEHFMGKFSQDVVTTQDEYTWDFTVASNMNGDATITWNNLALGDNDKELFLLDLSRQQLVNMRNAGSYTFDPKQSAQFRIYFGKDLEKKIRPSRITLSKAFPNPTSGVTSIAFSLPEQNAAANVSLEVFDLMGKKISTLVNGVLAPGFYATEWDTNMSNVAEGLYVCRLIVAGDEGQEVVSEKIIVKR